MGRDLSRILRPKSIAVIGGGAVARHVIGNCAGIGFTGPVWHVHPTRGNFAMLSDLPVPPDVAFVGVNRAATIGIVAALRDMGAGGAVAYASGFLEASRELDDGADLQARLLDAAGAMPLIGPNCYGFLNYLDGAGLWPDQQGGVRVSSGVAIITQSSNIAINLTMQKRGLPLAYLVTAGNQAQTGLAEIGIGLLDDPRITALGLHIEGIGDIAAFEALAAAARARGKPLVALKAGRSAQARAATVSHTASLAGSAAGADALLARLGIAQVASLSVLLETLKLLHVAGPLASNRIGSMSCSGGEASLMADGAVSRDLEFPPLDTAQKSALRAALGPMVALANPLDYHTYIWTDTPAMTATYSAMMLGNLGLGAVVADFPRADRCADADWEPVIDAVVATAHASGTPMAIVASLPETMPELTAARLIELGIAPMCGLDEALAAFEAAAWLGQPRGAALPVLIPGDPVAPAVSGEAEGKAALAGFGLDVPRSARAACLDRVAEISRAVGYPQVLKGEGLAHKTEAGAVALNLSTAADAEKAARAMPCASFLLEEMITGTIAELLVGV
ncbi:MAG: acetate--CoA ligase family protein, partial [Rhodobacter sp.]|nr:acetate--CoA ligase family protein [Rhodobacter sp.]